MYCKSCGGTQATFDGCYYICDTCESTNVYKNRLTKAEANYIRKTYKNAESIIDAIECALPSVTYLGLFSHCCFMCVVSVNDNPQPLYDICANVEERICK